MYLPTDWWTKIGLCRDLSPNGANVCPAAFQSGDELTWDGIHREVIRRSRRGKRGGILRFGPDIFSWFYVLRESCASASIRGEIATLIPQYQRSNCTLPGGALSTSDRLPVLPQHSRNAKSPHEAGFLQSDEAKTADTQIRTGYRRPFRRTHHPLARSDGLRRQRYRRPPDVRPPHRRG